MQTLTVICVGRLKDKFFEDASAEYIKRLSAYASVNVVEIKAAELPDNAGPALIEAALKKEGEQILKKIPRGAKTVAMCIEGKLFSSEDIAYLLSSSANSGFSDVAFIIGGSYGLSDDVKRACDIKMSMSKMTFPHRLARIMLLEQLYRGCKINAGEKYHK